MSDVTGNLGSESIRLRGMALESTQEEVLKVLSQMAKKQGAEGEGLSKVEAASQGATAAMKNQKNVLGKISTAFTAVGSNIAKLSEGMSDFSRTIRGADSNVKDSSYILRTMAGQTKGVTAAVARFGAQAVSQLEEQFDVYKKLSNVGGVVATDFEDMRIKASQLGITMQEYAGLVDSNLQNLRMGGVSARKSMINLDKSVKSLVEDNSGMTDQFQRLGIGASDYGQTILDQTMLLGGFGKVVDSTSTEFKTRMLDAAKVTKGLSDAFGFNREQVMKSATEAMKSGYTRNMLKSITNITDSQKSAVFQGFTGIFGDGGKAVEAMLAVYQGRFSKDMGEIQAITGGKFLPAIKIMAEEMENAKTPEEQRAAAERVQKRLGADFDYLRSAMSNYSRSVAFEDTAAQGRVSLIQNFLDTVGNPDKAFKNAAEAQDAVTNKNRTALDTLGDVQRQNLKMAVSFAETNKVLNKFGITTAFASQLIYSAAARMAKGAATATNDAVESYKIDDLIVEATKKGQQYIDNLGNEMEKRYKEQFPEAPSNKKPTGPTPPTGPVGPTVAVPAGNLSVQGRQINNASQLDAQGLEATRGGQTPEYMRQIINTLAASQKLNITGVRDTHGRPGSAHRDGLALDFTIPEGAAGFEKVKAQVDAMMKEAGLAQSDYYLKNEYVEGSPTQTGKHIHLQLTPKGAEKYQTYQTKLAGGPGAPRVEPPKTQTANDGNKPTTTATVTASSATDATKPPVASAPQPAPAAVNSSSVNKEDFSKFSSDFIKSMETQFTSLKNQLSIDIRNVGQSIERKISKG